jgi:hypothetical protein
VPKQQLNLDFVSAQMSPPVFWSESAAAAAAPTGFLRELSEVHSVLHLIFF